MITFYSIDLLVLIVLLGLPRLSSHTTWSFRLSNIAILAILKTDLWHSIIAKMSGVAMVLIVYIVIATFIVFSRDTSLDPFIHGSTLESLFGCLVDSHRIAILLHHHIISSNRVVLLSSHRLIIWSSCLIMLILSSTWILWRLLLGRNIVCRTVFLDLCQNTKPSLRWNKTWYDLLSNIFGRCSKEILKLDGTKFLDNRTLFAYTLVESLFKLI